MSRLEIGMTPGEIVLAITEDNIGAFRVCVELSRVVGQIDPLSDWFAYMAMLDQAGIYGKHVFRLAEIAGMESVAILAIIRASQLGIEGRSLPSLKQSIESGDIDVPATVAAVKARLPLFALESPRDNSVPGKPHAGG